MIKKKTSKTGIFSGTQIYFEEAEKKKESVSFHQNLNFFQRILYFFSKACFSETSFSKHCVHLNFKFFSFSKKKHNFDEENAFLERTVWDALYNKFGEMKILSMQLYLFAIGRLHLKKPEC